MKILEITNYTKGGCGVGLRVLRESKLLAELGHNVTIYSTNLEKGSNKICALEESIGPVKIRRFPAKKMGGESYMWWNFKKEAIKLNPDVIIAHSYRHPHTIQALKVAKNIGCNIFLVTHAPFARKSSRSFTQNILVKFYDLLIGRSKINQFTKVISITKWEQNYLFKLGLKKENLLYVPNGIEDHFFDKIKLINFKPKKIVYTGRISPIKNLDVVNRALAINKYFKFKAIGPADPDYLKNLKKSLSNLNLTNQVSIIPKSYNYHEQLQELDNSEVFILPSKSEGMPQTLVEAMARGKIVIGSDNDGNKELIDDGKNGFLFKNDNEKDLSIVLEKISSLSMGRIHMIQKNARKTAEKFKWAKIIEKLNKIIDNSAKYKDI